MKDILKRKKLLLFPSLIYGKNNSNTQSSVIHNIIFDPINSSPKLNNINTGDLITGFLN